MLNIVEAFLLGYLVTVVCNVATHQHAILLHLLYTLSLALQMKFSSISCLSMCVFELARILKSNKFTKI